MYAMIIFIYYHKTIIVNPKMVGQRVPNLSDIRPEIVPVIANVNVVGTKISPVCCGERFKTP